MRAVRGRNTGPELFVPGRPDIAFIGRRRALFVHGCFWHGHDCSRGARMPKTNAAFWADKIARNRTRDEATQQALEAIGWRSLVLWECELKAPDLADRLTAFLDTG